MKIEKLNENQIRCTLSSEDLKRRKIDLRELAYGSEKARNLFFDMMQQAKLEVGFDVNGTPLMVEAIPSIDTLTLIITKVNDPEELDTRFSSFSSPAGSSGSELHYSGADGILNLLKKIKDAAEKAHASGKTAVQQGNSPAGQTENREASSELHLAEAFRFNSLDEVIPASKAVRGITGFKNTLYKYDAGTYLLIVHSSEEDPEQFNRLCNILSEYSVSDHCSDASEVYLNEHGYLLIADPALSKLAEF